MKIIQRDLNFLLFICFAIFIILEPGLSAQNLNSDSTKRNLGLFEEDNIIEITLRFDLTRYFRTKPQEDYMKANITFHLSREDSISRDIKLKTRGVFRNQYCTFPPIELNLKKADFGYSDLDKISKLKLVTQCTSGSLKADYILREYLAYKLFNVLTDKSFRVRLLRINYIDSENRRKSEKEFGFFLEPVEMLITRTNSLQIRTTTLTQKSIVPEVMDRFTIFNYMIGNYDWAVPGLHNVLVIRPMDAGRYDLNLAIPHDFDWTGLVNASYAVPAENVGTDNVRQRIFQGVCRSREVYLKDLEKFTEKKHEFYRVINEFPYLNQRDKKDMTGYLDGFFSQMEGKNDNLVYELLKTCKNF